MLLYCSWLGVFTSMVERMWLGYGLNDPGFKFRQRESSFTPTKLLGRLWSAISTITVLFFAGGATGVSRWPLISIKSRGEEWAGLYRNPTKCCMAWTRQIYFLLIFTMDKHMSTLRLIIPWNLRFYREFFFYFAPRVVKFTELLHTNECTVMCYISLKFTLKCLKSSYMFRSLDHPQGAYIVPC
jgi:hypothetical protein